MVPDDVGGGEEVVGGMEREMERFPAKLMFDVEKSVSG